MPRERPAPSEAHTVGAPETLFERRRGPLPAPELTPGVPVPPLRPRPGPCGIPKVGGRRKEGPRARPLRRVGGAKPPGSAGPPPGGGRSWPRSAQSLFLPRGGGGGGGGRDGRRGDLTSGREVLSSRELSGGCQTRQVRGALPRRPPPRPGRPAPHRGRVGRKAAGEGECGAAGGLGTRVGARGQLGKFLGAAGRGRGRRPGACDSGCVSPGGVCESRPLDSGAGCLGGGARSASFWGGRLPKIPGCWRERPVPRSGASARGAGLFAFKSARC